MNDQLTRLERLRLEALSQAFRCPYPQTDNADVMFNNVLHRAEEIEKWLLAADNGGH